MTVTLLKLIKLNNLSRISFLKVSEVVLFILLMKNNLDKLYSGHHKTLITFLHKPKNKTSLKIPVLDANPVLKEFGFISQFIISRSALNSLPQIPK